MLFNPHTGERLSQPQQPQPQQLSSSSGPNGGGVVNATGAWQFENVIMPPDPTPEYN